MPETILIVDDSRSNRFMLAQLVRARNCQVLEAEGGRSALEILASQTVDLVLLDIRMPDLDGFAVLEQMKQDERLRHIPVIVVSSLDDLTATVRCISMGAEDFLMKPYEPTLLGARLRACLEKRRYLEELDQRNQQLEILNQRLEKLAFSDSLTGLPNRRFALQELTSHWSGACRHQRDLACLLVDLDHFKRYNDTYGHEVGDRVLCFAAEILKQGTRASDYVCRFGGEEFIIICPDTNATIGSQLAQRLLLSLTSQPLELDSQVEIVTASFGCAQRQPQMNSWNEMIMAADQALYEAKRAGRNCVKQATP